MQRAAPIRLTCAIRGPILPLGRKTLSRCLALVHTCRSTLRAAQFYALRVRRSTQGLRTPVARAQRVSSLIRIPPS